MNAIPIKAIQGITINDAQKALAEKGYSQKDIDVIIEVLVESQVKRPS